MSEPELRELGEDIRKRGLQNPVAIFLDAEGVEYLLDGINRLDAMEMAALPVVKDGTILDPDTVPTHILLDGNVDPYAYVLSANLLRRHLTTEQKRDLIAKLLKAKPDHSNRTIAKQVKADHKTVGTVREKLESTGEIPRLDKTTGGDGKERRHPEAKIAIAKAMERVSKAPEVEAPPKKPELATEFNEHLSALRRELNKHLNALFRLCRTESNWPPLNSGRQKLRAKAIKKLRSLTFELLELTKSAPRRGRPPKGRAS
jgi:hypothetical protein